MATTKRHHDIGEGRTIAAFARENPEFGSAGRIRRAVAKGDVRVIEFGGRKIIPPSEQRRLREMLELEPRAAATE